MAGKGLHSFGPATERLGGGEPVHRTTGGKGIGQQTSVFDCAGQFWNRGDGGCAAVWG